MPTGLLQRAAATGRIAASLGRAAARRLVRRSDADGRKLGDEMLAELDQLKGIAMKVGQILSYMDVGLPEETVRRLAHLQTGSRPLAFDVIRGVIEAELHAPLEQLFDSIDPAPVAAASIGQVHRAVLDGQPVAVKVRYPGVQDTVEGDFRQLARIGRLASLGTSVDGPALVQELRERMVEECDYGREAAWQQAFAQRWADEPEIDVPPLLPHRSSDGVLTTGWREGDAFELLCAAPQARRDAVAQTLVRFTFGSFFGGGVLHADPHPGNFLFPGNGRVVALDFGCVRRFPPDLLASARRLSRLVVDDERAGFPEAVLASGQVGRPDRFDYDDFWAFQRWLHAPWWQPGFHFEAGWLREGMTWTGPRARNARHMAFPPPWLWLMRIQAGLHAVLVKLGAQGDLRAAFREALDTPCDPLGGPA